MPGITRNILKSNSYGRTYLRYSGPPLWYWAKLDQMKEVYGEKAGAAIHITSYMVVPVSIGIVGIIAYCH
jgi:hypothetical protein